MDKLRSTQQFVTPTILKMPSISEIQFPKMKSRLNLQQLKLFKGQKSATLKKSDESCETGSKLVRSYSMSLMTIKKDLKNMYPPKKLRLNFNPESIICVKGQKGEQAISSNKIQQSMKLTIYPSQKQQEYRPQNQQINVQNALTQGSGQRIMRNSLYPGVKFESVEYAEKRTQFLKKFLPGLENVPQEASLTARVSKKKHLFNAKFIVNKKNKDQLPDELVTRKLIWDGRQMKKIDHNLIYRDLVQKVKNQKNQKLQDADPSTKQDKIMEFMRLSAWEFHDEQKQGQHPGIQTSRI